MSNLIPIETIENKIYLIRGQKVMLDSDLAKLYGVRTKALNQAIKRNIERFPDDFMFQLDENEYRELTELRSQFVTSKKGGRRYLPFVFTEQGIAMLSSVLNSKKAIQVNIVIIRVFVKLRQILSTHKDFAYKLADLEKKYEGHDKLIKGVFDAIRQLMAPKAKRATKIGFQV